MVFVANENGMFTCKKSDLNDAGNGVFCARKVKAGTILPYFGIAISDSDDEYQEDSKRTYVISADYTTIFGNQRTLKGLSVDGNPRLPQIKVLEEYQKLASQTNEASGRKAPNCLLVSNPRIRRKDIVRSLLKKEPIPITYLVVIKDLRKGTELLTCYGEDYGKREYTPFTMNKAKLRKLIDFAYKNVDALPAS